MIDLPATLAPLVACVLRAAAFFQFAPVIGEHMSTRARLGLSVCLGWMLSRARPSCAISMPALAGEVLGGALLAGVLTLAWAMLTAAIGSSLTSALGDEEPAGDLARATGLASFLALSGDHWLVTVLAAPVAPGLDLNQGQCLGDLGASLFSGALAAMLPLALVLAAVRVVMALAVRGASMDVSRPSATVVAAAGIILVAAWLPGVLALYESGLERAATAWLTAPVRGP